MAIRQRYLQRLDGTFVPLLVALISWLIFSPAAKDFPIVVTILVSVLLLTGIFAVHRNPPLRIAMVVGLLVVLFLDWLTSLVWPESRFFVVGSHLVVSAYLVAIALIVLNSVVRHQIICVNTIIGAVCGYILIGLIFAFWYAALEGLCSGSIVAADWQPKGGPTHWERVGSEFTYFSFVTLASLGYGDILPVGGFARTLAILEVMMGQLYLAAFIARLVSLMRR